MLGDKNVPFEILWCIFKQLSATDLLECRRVCKRWKEGVDNLSFKFWREECEKTYGRKFSHEALKKSRLSWAELYNSLSMWPAVSAADYDIFEVPSAMNIQRFTLLRNNILVYPRLSVKNVKERGLYDTLVYLDLNNCKVVETEQFELLFKKYAITENTLVVEQFKSNGRLVYKQFEVFLRRYNKRFVFGKNKNQKILQWFLCNDEIFYQTSNYTIIRNVFCVIRNDIELMTSEVGSVIGAVIGIAVRSDMVKVITDEEDIYDMVDGDTRHVCCLHQTFDSVDLLAEHGFRWSSPSLLPYLTDICITAYMLDAAHAYGNKVIVCGTGSMIHIYCDPYVANEELELSNKKPDVTIDLCSYRKDNFFDTKEIEQIDIIETLNGHKIIVLYCHKLLIINLEYDNNKRKAYKSIMITKTESESIVFWRNMFSFVVNIILICGTLYCCGHMLHLALDLIGKVFSYLEY